MSASEIWLAQAHEWAAWARQGDDGFSAFRALLPGPGRATLDLGCGEGRFTRALGRDGHAVTGADISAELVDAARAADPGGRYVAAEAEALPFEDGAFDLVLAFNVFSCVEALQDAVRESARVLTRGGLLCLSVVHPMYTAGRRTDGRWVIDSGYGIEHLHTERVRRDAVELTFANIHRPLGAYTAALEQAGFLIEALREPEWELVPMFLYLRALKA
jgi:ubiquinone/menaquinone biosynthesis C-methylase UbiE